MEKTDNNNMPLCTGVMTNGICVETSEQMESDCGTSSSLSVIGCGEIERQHNDDSEKQNDIEEELLNKDNAQVGQALYSSFQATATSVAQIFKECYSGSSEGVCISFQATSNAVTKLYHDGMDAYKYGVDFGTQCGYQRRNKELVNWLKKKRRMISRDELIAFLTGISSPARQESITTNDSNPVAGLPRSNSIAAAPSASHRRRIATASQVEATLDSDHVGNHIGKKRSVTYADYYMDCPTPPSQKRYRMDYNYE